MQADEHAEMIKELAKDPKVQAAIDSYFARVFDLAEALNTPAQQLSETPWLDQVWKEYPALCRDAKFYLRMTLEDPIGFVGGVNWTTNDSSYGSLRWDLTVRRGVIRLTVEQLIDVDAEWEVIASEQKRFDGVGS